MGLESPLRKSEEKNVTNHNSEDLSRERSLALKNRVIEVIQNGSPEDVARLVEDGDLLRVQIDQNVPEDSLYEKITEDALVTFFTKLTQAVQLRKDTSLIRSLAFFGPQRAAKGKDSFYSKRFRAAHAVINNPELNRDRNTEFFLRQLEDLFMQDGQMIDADTLLGEVADTAWREHNVPASLRHSALSGLNYVFSFSWQKEHEDAIVANLDFKSPERYAKTGHFLELMSDLYSEGADTSYSEDRVPQVIEKTIQRVVDRNDGSYLLNLRARQVLDAMKNGDTWHDHDRVPFKITQNRFAWHREDGLYLSSVDDASRIEGLITDLRDIEKQITPPQKLIDEAMARGENEVYWEPDERLMSQRSKKYAQIERLFSVRCTYGDLLSDARAVPFGESGELELHDFSYLMQKPVREAIEKEFSIELTHLSIPDQYELLRFLKNVEKRNASPLFLEASKVLKRLGALNLQDIRGGSLESISGTLIPPADAEAMLTMQKEHYSEKYPEGLFEELRAGLEGALANPESRFYVYRKDGEIVSFVRFEDNQDASDIHMASFVTSSQYAGGALGQALLETALNNELKRDAKITAECDPSLVRKYQEYGFVVRDTRVDVYGVPTVDIELPAKASSNVERAA